MLRVLKRALTVVEHLAVGVVQNADAGAVPGMQRLQGRRHVIICPGRIIPGFDQLVDLEGIALGSDIAIPESSHHEGVVFAGAVAQIEHHLGVVLGEREFDDIERGAGQLFPRSTESMQRAGNAALRSGGVDRDRNLSTFERLFRQDRTSRPGPLALR